MKCAFLYDFNRKNSKVFKKIKMIEAALKEKYSEVLIFPTKSVAEFSQFFQKEASYFDYVIITGGDGTFNLMANEVAKLDKKPIIGYIPSGTVCDNMNKYKLSRSIDKALSVIFQDNSKEIETMKINDYYSTYAFAKGKFVKISYKTSSILKKFLGKLAYYFSCLKELVTINKIRLTLKAENLEENGVYTLVLITNSNHVAGMKISKNYVEGKFNLYLFKKGFRGFINVLLFFIFGDKLCRVKKRSIRKYELEHLEVIAGKNKDNEWSNDGEKMIETDFKVSLNKNTFKLLVPRKED